MPADNLAAKPGAVSAGRPTERSGLHLALRIFITLQAAAILFQGVTAGQLLNGTDSMKDVHASGAAAVHLTALVQLVLAILWWRPGRGAGWPALVSLLIALLGFVQSAVGGSHNLAVHVPLGMALLGVSVAILVWAWSPRSVARPGHT
jgi:hypothetical protein